MPVAVREPPTLDLGLAQRADRKLRRYGGDLNRLLSLVVNLPGRPDFVASEPAPQPLAADDPRLDAVLASAKVRRAKGGGFVAEVTSPDDFWSAGPTRKAALGELREDLRYLIADPVKVTYTVYGRTYVAEARPSREGVFWAVVPSLDGIGTQGATMDELRYMLVDMTKVWIEES